MTGFKEAIRVLLVDDEREFLEAVAPGLGRRGFEVTLAESGTAALELLANQTFDVIVLDVRLPGINGVDTFREIKRSVPDLPVILLSGHSSVDDVRRGLKEGAFDYLTKPQRVEDLFDHIRAAWERRKRRRDEELRREAERVLEERPD